MDAARYALRRGSMSNKMKKSVFSVVVLFSLLSFKEVYAADYGTTGDISFYGSYEYPKDELLPKPIQPESENKPELELVLDPEPIPSPTPILIQRELPRTRLPQTGESKQFNRGSIGIVFLALGLMVYTKNKKNKGSFKNEIN